MYSIYLLFLFSLLQAGQEGIAPNASSRLPAVVPKPFVAASTPAVPPVTTNDTPSTVETSKESTADPKQFYQRGVILALPTPNHVSLAAPTQAILKSLTTTQQDEAGNILQDKNGNPMTISITEGMYVSKGQLLGNFDDQELQSTLKINQAQLEVAKAERNKRTELIYAAESLRVAIADYQAMVQANERMENTFPEIEVRRAALAQAQAAAHLDLQKYNLDEVKAREVSVRENELRRTEILIEQRKLFAPIDGMIVKIHAPEGKWLREGDLVLEIVQLDTLWVRVDVDVRKYESRALEGKQANVYVTLPNEKQEMFSGTVVFCNPLVKSDYTYDVLVEVQNRREGNYWLLQPGRGDLDIVIPLVEQREDR